MPGDRVGTGAEPSLSVVVPCYNEEESIRELHRRVSAVCRDMAGDDHEIVLINDGSRDATWTLIEELIAEDGHVVGIDLSRNHGHQLALSAGLSVCRGHRILIIDADLQDPPELLPDMMALMDGGADVVYGQRRVRHGETRFKTASAALFYRVLDRLVDTRIPVDTGDFRLMSRRALDQLLAMPERHRFIRGMVSWIGFRQEPLLYDRQERFAGETKYPLSKMVRFAIDAITSFSTRPLQFASVLGIVFGMSGVLGMIYALASWAAGNTVPGWTSVIIIVLILGSVQLFVLGIFGEYLGRMYMEAKRRPLFVIADIRRGQPPAATVSRPVPADEPRPVPVDDPAAPE